MKHCERVRAAWAALANVDALTPLQVLVRPESYLCPRGWIGILRIEECVTAVAPTPELVSPLTSALADLSPEDATSPDRVAERLPGVVETLGPAKLYYRGDRFPAATSAVTVDVVPLSQIGDLLAAADADELEESGLAHVASKVSVIRSEFGEPVAACGYRYWPEQIAHLSVLTRADHRRKRLAAAVAIDAIGARVGRRAPAAVESAARGVTRRSPSDRVRGDGCATQPPHRRRWSVTVIGDVPDPRSPSVRVKLPASTSAPGGSNARNRLHRARHRRQSSTSSPCCCSFSPVSAARRLVNASTSWRSASPRPSSPSCGTRSQPPDVCEVLPTGGDGRVRRRATRGGEPHAAGGGLLGERATPER